MKLAASTLNNSLYAKLSPWQARGVLLIAMTFFTCGLAFAPAPQKLYTVNEQATADDVLLYLAEIERMHAGEEYYQVAAQELVSRGFPTQSVFNWRTPLPLWIMANLPSLMTSRLILIGATTVLVLLSALAAQKEEASIFQFAFPLCLLLTAPLCQCCVGEVFVMTEVWAGLAIALSVVSYGLELWLVAAGFGLASLFLRELALPYCAVCLALSIWQKRKSEILIWVIGLAAWSVHYASHCWIVSALIEPNAVAHQRGWIQFGGLRFLLGTVQVNFYLLTIPMPMTVAYLTLSMLGLAGWSSSWGRRIAITTIVYAVAFCIAGQDFNRYWGYLTVPLLCYGVARAPLSILELFNAAKFIPSAVRNIDPDPVQVGVATAN